MTAPPPDGPHPMTRTVTIFVWLALIVGIPQVLMGVLGLYEGGTRMAYWATLIVLPFLPMLLVVMQKKRETASPVTPQLLIILALASTAVSIWIYADVVRTFAAD